MKISENTDNRVRKSAVCIMAAVLMMCGTLASCGNSHSKTTDSSAETSAPSADESTQETSAQDDSGSQNAANTEFVADLLPTSDEDIGENSFIITLREDKAPITCENFEKLVSEGFYDGTTSTESLTTSWRRAATPKARAWAAPAQISRASSPPTA